MKKSFVLAFSLALLLVAFFSGCGDSSTSPTDEVSSSSTVSSSGTSSIAAETPEIGWQADVPAEYTYLVSAQKVGKLDKDTVSGSYRVLGFLTGSQAPEARNDAGLYFIEYKTLYLGDTVTASGMVGLPETSGNYSTVLFYNGTNTDHSAAPSASWDEPGIETILGMSAYGLAVAYPDYLGFGSSSDMMHPYVHKESTVRSGKDMLLALAELADLVADVGISGDLWISGYSQGAWSTLATHQALERTAVDGYSLQGSVAGSGPYDLKSVLDFALAQPEYDSPHFLGYVAWSYATVYDVEDSIKAMFRSPYNLIVAEMYTGAYSGGYIDAQLNSDMDSLFTADFISGFDSGAEYEWFRDLVQENSVTGWNLANPVYLYHGDADTDVPVSNTRNIEQEFLDAGSAASLVDYTELANDDHGSAALKVLVRGLNVILAAE